MRGGEAVVAATSSEARALEAISFAPLVPEQLVARRALQPEKQLMVAVLEDAVAVVRRVPLPPLRTRCGLRWVTHSVQEDARAWFASEDASWPFTFIRICEALGLDAGGIRRELGIEAA